MEIKRIPYFGFVNERLCLIFLLLFGLFSAKSQQLVINEFMSNNVYTLQDNFGEYPDWIELYNPSDVSVNLSGYYLTDDPDQPEKWKFPSLNLLPNNFLLILASGKDTVTSSEIHTNFKINADGETLILLNDSGLVLDWIEGVDLGKNKSLARIPDGSVSLKVCYLSSPSLSNTNNTIQNKLKLSHPAGIYQESIELEIIPEFIGDQIFYTLDGTKPNINSFEYSGPIYLGSRKYDDLSLSMIPTTPLSGPYQLKDYIWKKPEQDKLPFHTIRFQAFSNKKPSSKIYSKTFLVQKYINQNSPFTLISLITDPNNLFDYDTGIYIPGARYDSLGWHWWPEGNYINNGIDWEREVHVEFFNSSGSLLLAQNCGLRIFGGWSASMPQKSLRLVARKIYDKSQFKIKLFNENKESEYKNIVLRNSGNDFNSTHLRDIFMQGLLSGLDIELQNFKPGIAYINGEYWGIYNIRQKYDEDYFEEKFNVENDDLIMVGVCGYEEIGSNSDYFDLINYIKEHDLENDFHYESISAKIDIINFIDYNIAQIYFGNYDWPCNNTKAWKTTSTDSKWRWLPYDLDYGFGLQNTFTYNKLNEILHDNHNSENCCTFLLRELLKNHDFKNQFIDRFVSHLNTTFNKDTVLKKLDNLVSIYEIEIQNHINRWVYPNTKIQWYGEVEYLKEFAIYRPCYLRDHIMTSFNLNDLDFKCDIPSNPQKNFNVFPNPCFSTLYIEREKPFIESTKLSIYNLLGQKIMDRGLDYTTNMIHSIDVSHLPDGIYILYLYYNNNTTFVQKIIVQ